MLIPGFIAMRRQAANGARDVALILASVSLLILAVLWWMGW